MNLNQITLPATDLAVSVPFYQGLGLELIVDARPRYARFACPGGSTFSLHHSEEPVKGAGAWVYFECEALDEQVKALQSAGFQFETLPEDMPWRWREARLKDPDGNQLILYHAGKNRLNPPWRLQREAD